MSGSWRIPFFGVDRQYLSIRDEILEYTDKVYSSGHMLDGPFTESFEREMAKRCRRRYAVTVNSGTQGLIFALQALDTNWLTRPNRGKILIPSISYVATVNAVIEAGYDPIFCDVDPLTGLMDLNSIPVSAQNIHAIMYVNLFGNCLNYNELLGYRELFKTKEIPIIEDAAQSFGASFNGAPSGSLGDFSVLSFDPTKNLNNYGSGGMILTDDIEYRNMFLNVKNNGKKDDHTVSGTNSKMGEADCAQMLVKLKYFDAWQKRRQEIAEYYSTELTGFVATPEHDHLVTHAWSKYVIHHSDRNILVDGLSQNGIETKVHYARPLHLESVSFMSAINNNDYSLEGAEEFCKTALSLPIYPELTDDEIESIVGAVRYYS